MLQIDVWPISYEILILVTSVVITIVFWFMLKNLLNDEKRYLIQNIRQQIKFQTNTTKDKIKNMIGNSNNTDLDTFKKNYYLEKYYDLCKYHKYLVYSPLLEEKGVEDLRKINQNLKQLDTIDSDKDNYKDNYNNSLNDAYLSQSINEYIATKNKERSSVGQ